MRMTIIASIAAIVFTGSALWAHSLPLRRFVIGQTVTINGARVLAGAYDVSIKPQGSKTEASFWQNGKFVAAAHGTWVKHGIKYAYDAALALLKPDGSRALIEMRFAGTDKSFMLDDTAMTVPSSRLEGENGKADAH